MEAQGSKSPVVVRLAGEFIVIVVGVLVALATDRWSQSLSAAEAERVYVERLMVDIRADSVEAEGFLTALPEAIAARDSLLSALEGEGPLPADLQAAVERASNSSLRRRSAPHAFNTRIPATLSWIHEVKRLFASRAR